MFYVCLFRLLSCVVFVFVVALVMMVYVGCVRLVGTAVLNVMVFV